MTQEYDVAIIGGGISGLSAAYFLQQYHPDVSAIIIEASPRVGGWVQTIKLPSGQQYEAGPRSILIRGEEGIATSDLISSLGLENEVLMATKESSTRYVVLGQKPVPLPAGFLDPFDDARGQPLQAGVVVADGRIELAGGLRKGGKRRRRPRDNGHGVSGFPAGRDNS